MDEVLLSTLDGANWLADWVTPPAVQYAKSTCTSGSNLLSTTSFAEVHSSLRVTVVVPPSGNVLLKQSAVLHQDSGAGYDCIFAYQLDGAGGWTQTGGTTGDTGWPTVSIEYEVTGLTPGSHTFYMGWRHASNTVTIHSGDRGGANPATWQSATTMP